LTAFNNCSSDVIKLRGSEKYSTELAVGKTGDGGYTETGLSACSQELTTVTAKTLLLEKSSVHFKENVSI
jgi:hypothetical protein